MTASPVRTIADLARLAGASAATVSRALAGSPLVKEDTRVRIVELAREHGFSLNVTARNLRRQTTNAIGVIVPLGHASNQHISDPFFMALLGPIADRLTERGYDLLLSRVIPEDDDWLSRIVQSGRVDGVIVIGQSDQSETLDAVAARYQPMVVWGALRDGQIHCSVGSDNFAGGRIAAEHLLAKGRRRLAFLGDPQAPEIAQRLAGCRSAVESHGGSADAVAVLPAPFIAEDAHAMICDWIATTQPPPDGIVAGSDVIALCALRAFAEAGFDVPGDIAVVGYDDLSFATQTTPPLTSIRQDLQMGAEYLVDVLFRRMKGEQTESIVLPPLLIERAST